jgi:hypothetical protein
LPRREGSTCVGLHARSVVLISQRALRLLNADELQGVVAHEIGHEYVWDEYQAALERKDARRLQELELFCDGVAIVTLRLARLEPGALARALKKITRFNHQHLGIATNEAHYPRLAERHRFIEAVIAWSNLDEAICGALPGATQNTPATTTCSHPSSGIDIEATPIEPLPASDAMVAPTAAALDTAPAVNVVERAEANQWIGLDDAPVPPGSAD